MDVFHNNPRGHKQKDVSMVLSLWFWSSQLKAACSTWDLDNLLYAHDDIMVNFRGYFSVTRSYITIPSCKACFSSSLIFLSEAFLYLSNSLSFSSLSLSITGSENMLLVCKFFALVGTFTLSHLYLSTAENCNEHIHIQGRSHISNFTGRFPVGQNLAMGHRNFSRAIRAWYNEVNLYTFGMF